MNRKTPLQKRSKDTVEAILSVSRLIIIEEGVLNFNTNNIAKRAGVSVGSIYQYFNSKESILMALIHSDFSIKIKHIEEKFVKLKNYPFEGKIKEIINVLFDLNENGEDLVLAGKYLQIGQLKKFHNEFQNEVIERSKNFIKTSSEHLCCEKIESTLFVFFQSINSENIKEHQENIKSTLFNIGTCYLQN